MELQGKVAQILNQEEINTGKMQKIIFTTRENYPQTHEIEFWNKAIHELSGVREGQEITVHINLRSNKSQNGKYYSKIVGWKVNKHPQEVDNMSQLPLRG
tara:strand:+ start:552 stop:851 length:300 start_codon:yes stop_codon:yes gene_type:complete